MPRRTLAAGARALHRRPPLALAIALAAAAFAPGNVAASCQTIYCRYFTAVGARETEADLREKLADEPRDPARWDDLFHYISNKPRREAFIARYEALDRWEPQPALEIDIERQLESERRAWLMGWKQADPDSGEPWCREADWESDPAERVALLRRAADILPDDPRVHGCLASALAAAGDAAAGLGVLEDLRDRRPDDPDVWNTLVSNLRGSGNPEALRGALEERVRRFPDDPNARRELLLHYDQAGLVAARDQLLAEIESGADFETRWRACSALVVAGDDGARVRCNAALLEDFPPESVPEDRRHLLDSARDSVLMPAIHAADWPALRRVLAAWPPETLVDAWARVADWLDAEGCAAMVAALRAGELAPALGGPQGKAQATHLGWALRECGEPALADEVVRPFLAAASDQELAQMGSRAAQAELARRSAESGADALRLRRLDDGRRHLKLKDRFADLLLWLAADPTDPEPARRLSEASAAEGDAAAAVQWLREAAERTPGEVEPRLALGALALRLRLDTEAAAAARHVLAGDASPRQHAEAHYLLGRVALRQGRREDAASELLQYFPLRLRYAGCCGAAACDRGLQLLLLGNYDLPRLSAYLRERDAAVAWFEERLRAPAKERRDGLPCMDEPLPGAVEPAVATGCAMPAALAALERASAERPADGELARRLREAKKAPSCTSPPPFDVETLFPDDRLLTLGAELREVD